MYLLDSLVLDAYRSNWQNFYSWKKTYAENNLATLLVECKPSSNEPIDILSNDQEEILASGEKTSGSTLYITEYVDGGDSSNQYTLQFDKFTVKPEHNPYADYTSCTPIRRNILVEDDLNPMPFLPFSDDPSFFHDIPLKVHYETYAWQNPDDPDIEVICVQTVKQLMETHDLKIEQIAETNVMPVEVIQKMFIDSNVMPAVVDQRMVSYVGAHRRDYLPWPPISPLHPTNVPYKPKYIDASPTKILEELVGAFCISDCHHGYCDTHMSDTRPLPQPVSPTLTNENLFSTVDKPCSRHCFILGHYIYNISYWSPEDLEILHLTLAYSPDTLPCDLAVIVRKSCHEVATQRQVWLMTQPPIAPSQSKPLTRRNSKNLSIPKLEFADFDSDIFNPNQPCSHPGPCTTDSRCPCAESNIHCIGYCDCSKKCIRKWRGCTCAKSRYLPLNASRTCGTDRCPCFRAHRECDPILCIRCDSRDPTSDVCKNSGLQHMRHKRGMVHRGKWNLGYYILEAAREGDLIHEYVGDLIYDLTVRSRDPVASHTGRQYMFKLNSIFTVDGTVRGNESRYINHASGDKANVRAHVRLTNSEHRIGIYAAKDINPGTELLLDYGSDFFQAFKHSSGAPKTKPSSQSTRKTQNTPTTQLISDSPLILSSSYYKSLPAPQPPPISPTPLRRTKTVPSSSNPSLKTSQKKVGTRGDNGTNTTQTQGRITRKRRYLTNLTLEEDMDEESEYRKSSSDATSG